MLYPGFPGTFQSPEEKHFSNSIVLFKKFTWKDYKEIYLEKLENRKRNREREEREERQE